MLDSRNTEVTRDEGLTFALLAVAGLCCRRGLKVLRIRAFEVMEITSKALIFVWGMVGLGFY